jgi:hypothetical protein
MKKREVTEMDGCKYIEVNDEGLVIERKEGKKSTLEVRKTHSAAPLRSAFINSSDLTDAYHIHAVVGCIVTYTTAD